MEWWGDLPPVMVWVSSMASDISTILRMEKVSVRRSPRTLETMWASRRLMERPMRSPPAPTYLRGVNGEVKPLCTMMEPMMVAKVSKVGLAEVGTRVGQPASAQLNTMECMKRRRSARQAGWAMDFLVSGVLKLRSSAEVARKRSQMRERRSTSAEVPMALPVANIWRWLWVMNVSSPPSLRPVTSLEVATMLRVLLLRTGISSSMW